MYTIIKLIKYFLNKHYRFINKLYGFNINNATLILYSSNYEYV